ncbi:MAG: methyltransferase domain-containing protein [Pseudomonadales bacterium]|nr:methyltransferase domain-containing protein [Pseudomonadales bacterium]
MDIACGSGANALYLAERGLHVDAWDISDVVVSHLENRHPRLYPRALDITAAAIENSRYDLILTCHYLDPSLAKAIVRATHPGGLIIYQTFTAGKKADIGPRNPDFLLKPGQLESFVSGCRVLRFEDGTDIVDQGNPMAGRAYIIAQKNIDQ